MKLCKLRKINAIAITKGSYFVESLLLFLLNALSLLCCMLLYFLTMFHISELRRLTFYFCKVNNLLYSFLGKTGFAFSEKSSSVYGRRVFFQKFCRNAKLIKEAEKKLIS